MPGELLKDLLSLSRGFIALLADHDILQFCFDYMQDEFDSIGDWDKAVNQASQLRLSSILHSISVFAEHSAFRHLFSFAVCIILAILLLGCKC